MMARIIFESVPILILCASISISTGLIIERGAELFLKWPLLLISIPFFIDLAGDTASTFANRFTTTLQLGLKALHLKNQASAIATAASGALTVLLMTALIYPLSRFLNLSTPPIELFAATLLLSLLVMMALSFAIAGIVALLTFRHGLDPNNFSSPVIATLCDLFGATVLINVASVLLP